MVFSAIASSATAGDLRVGILSNRGDLQARTAWGKFVAYLTSATGETCQLVPVTLDRTLDIVRGRQVDVLLSNPIITTQLHVEGHVDPVAMLVLPKSDRFGGVIIASKKSAIREVDGIRGRRLMFLNRSGAGAFLFQAYHLRQKGIDVDKDVAVAQPAQKQDDIVLAVRAGLFDVGFIRTGLLEDMTQDGKLKPDDVVVLDRIEPTEGFPFVRSTALYPEWFLVVQRGLDPERTARLASALVALSPDHEAARAAEIGGFRPAGREDMAPLIALMTAMKIGPFAN